MVIKASEPVSNPNLTYNSSLRTLRKSSKLERKKPSSNSPQNPVPKLPSWLFNSSTSGFASGSSSIYHPDTSVATSPSRVVPPCSVTTILPNGNQSIRTRCKP
ncbi:hypothetical protein Adt_44799 [Abeliophyllum distichum]|uniref:Uncharacterized protein n=1 Tax=Abeliophyllum distichum TaxID=126358 RepID=A0ABD1PE90_9LAMI